MIFANTQRQKFELVRLVLGKSKEAMALGQLASDPRIQLLAKEQLGGRSQLEEVQKAMNSFQENFSIYHNMPDAHRELRVLQDALFQLENTATAQLELYSPHIGSTNNLQPVVELRVDENIPPGQLRLTPPFRFEHGLSPECNGRQ